MSIDNVASGKQALAEALKRLLAEAQAAVSSEHGDRMAVIDKLIEFIAASPEGAGELDDIARRAAEDLIGTDVQHTLTSLAARTRELDAQVRALLGDISSS